MDSSLTLTTIPEPEKWVCNVDLYHVGHREMQIVAGHTETRETLYIVFVAVEYFEGPIMWTGANFQIHPQEECRKLLNFIGCKYSERDFDMDYALFSCPVVNSEIARVRIIAAPAVSVSRENPFSFSPIDQ